MTREPCSVLKHRSRERCQGKESAQDDVDEICTDGGGSDSGLGGNTIGFPQGTAVGGRVGKVRELNLRDLDIQEQGRISLG